MGRFQFIFFITIALIAVIISVVRMSVWEMVLSIFFVSAITVLMVTQYLRGR